MPVKRIMMVLVVLCAWVALICLIFGDDVNRFLTLQSLILALSAESVVSGSTAPVWLLQREQRPASDLKLRPTTKTVLLYPPSHENGKPWTSASAAKIQREFFHSKSLQEYPDNFNRSRLVGNAFLEARRRSLPLLDFPEVLPESSRRYLIYRCERGCGGWADRVKGILTGYLIANLTKRMFKVEIRQKACPLSDFLVPRSLNWSLPRSFHPKMDTRKGETHILNLIDNSGFNRVVSSTNFNRYLQARYRFIYYKSNLDYMTAFQKTRVHKAELSWMKNLTRDAIHAALYSHLLRLPPHIQVKVENFFTNALPSGWRKLVCAHVRMGRNPSIPKDTVVRTRPEHLKNVWTFLGAHSTSTKEPIFLMSDSQDVLTEAKGQRFGSRVLTVPGQVIHIERSGQQEKQESLCEGLTKVLVEQHILMSCDVIMISKSGLGRMAAYLRGTDDGLYCLMPTGEVIPCRAREIKEIYHLQG